MRTAAKLMQQRRSRPSPAGEAGTATPARHGWEVYAPGGELIGTAGDVRGALRLYDLVRPTVPWIALVLWSNNRLVEILWWEVRH